MTRLVLQRLGQTAVVLFGVTVIVFAVLRIMPGDPVSLMFSGDDDAGNLAAREEYAAMLGLDRPLPVQYLSFLEDVSQGDLGKSFRRNVPVSQLVGEALPLTIELTLAGLFIAIAIAVPVAILSALKQNSIWDRGGTFLALIGVSMPSFWQAIMLILILAVTFPILPVSGVIDIGLSVERVTGLPTLDSILTGNWEAMRSLLAHLVLPAFTLGTGVAAQFTRVLRSSLLEVKHQDFIDAL